MAEMLASTSSSEVVEWIAEMILRREDEKEAMDRARSQQGE